MPSEADPFADLDDNTDNSDAEELLLLMNVVQGSDAACAPYKKLLRLKMKSQFVQSLQMIDTWDETFMSELQPNNSETQISSDEDECEQGVPEPPAKRVKTYKEAVKCLEDVFLEQKGHTEAATEADILVNKVTKFQCSQNSCSVQSSITSYFKPS